MTSNTDLQEPYDIDVAEQDFLIELFRKAEDYGFGTVIGHLKTEWVRRLMSDGVPEEKARRAADAEGFPLDFPFDDEDED